MITSLYANNPTHQEDNIIMLPLAYRPGLNTEFNFDWIPNFVYAGNQIVFPKDTFDGPVHGSSTSTLGAFNNIFYDAVHNTYNDLPDLYSLQNETDRQYSAEYYMDPKTSSMRVIDRTYRTYSPLRTNTSIRAYRMTKIKMKDLNYVAPDPDWEYWKPHPYRYQDCYWLRTTNPARNMTIQQIIGWAILLLYDLPDLSTQTLGYIENIGFTFLTGPRETADDESYLGAADPQPHNTSSPMLVTHYGYGPGNYDKVASKAVVLKDFTKKILGVNVRHTFVALKGIYCWLSESFYCGIISQPYLNFGYGTAPDRGKVLMLGAEYVGVQN